MVRGLVAGLLMLAALVAVAGAGTVKTFPSAAFAQTLQTATAAAAERQAVVQEFVSADRDAERPCGRDQGGPGIVRCPAVQCITVCGGLPAAFALPAPGESADAHVFVTDDPLRGISTIPDLPPPRLPA